MMHNPTINKQQALAPAAAQPVGRFHKPTPEESVSALFVALQKGKEVSELIRDREGVVAILGMGGSGKSLFMNYLMGCAVRLRSAKKLGVSSLFSLPVVKAPEKVVHAQR